MKVRVFILRHGRTANNINGITQDVRDDIGLCDSAYTELAAHSATFLYQLGKDSLTHIVCSPMLRAKQTASAFADILIKAGIPLSVSFNDDMTEVDFGDFGSQPDNAVINGMTMADYRLQTISGYLNAGYDFTYPNGEKFSDIRRRVIACLCDLVDAMLAAHHTATQDVNFVLVGHNRWFRHMLAEIDEDYRQVMFERKLPHGQLVPVDIDMLATLHSKVQKLL